MTKFEDPYNNVIQFPIKAVPKFGFERATIDKDKKRDSMEHRGQMTLFEPPNEGEVVRLPMSPFAEAFLLDEQGDPRAVESYRKAIAEEDCIPDAYCNLGIMQSKEGSSAPAFDSFTNALKHDPRHFESHYNLGNLYFESDNMRLARVHYEFAAEIRPTVPYVYFNLGLLYALDQNFKASIDALTKYKEYAPEDDTRQVDELITSIKLSIASQS